MILKILLILSWKENNMATTEKGVYYQVDYTKIADIHADMKKMAESIDK